MTAVGERYLEGRQSESLHELFELLRIPSISALPEHAGDVQRAAEWVANRLRAASMEHVEVLATGGHPVVYADWLHAPGKPTVLIYGHFDVQPADPLNLWISPPFEPEVREGRLYARGASDMKANLLMSILGVEANLRETGTLPVNIKFFVEGQEEIGSPQLPDFMAEQRGRFAADLVLSGDGMQWSESRPLLLTSMRGGCGVQIDVRGAAADLHSGLYGGLAPNPIQALAHILDTMKSPDGKILVEGFYDDVVSLSGEERAALDAVPFDEAAMRQELGVRELVGEPGYTPFERNSIRPTLDVNGIWGGFQGEGVKTVIPSEAHAKITCRLVPNQQPERIVKLLIAHARRNAPPGVDVSASSLAFVARPYQIPADHWANQVAGSVLEDLYGTPPFEMRMGASVPVCELFETHLGAPTVTFGFGQPDEQAHAPNEFLRLENFTRGQRAWAALIDRLSEAAALHD